MFALAVGEEANEFEHRDLHWGNVLIQKSDKKKVIYKFGEIEYHVPVKNKKVSFN